MNEILKVVLSLSISGTFLIFILLLIRPMVKHRLSKRWQYYIWLVVIARLLIPCTPETSIIGNLYQSIDMRADQKNTMTKSPLDISVGKHEGSIVADEINDFDSTKSGTSISAVRYHIFLELLWANLWIIWLLIALVLLIRKITIYQCFIKYIRAGYSEVREIKLLEQLGKIVDKNNIRASVELYINPLISTPLLIGFIRPCIVLPSADLSSANFENIVQHELVHHKRGDMFYKWLVQFTICLHWFNPLIHWISHEINRSCELSCDEAVIKKLDKQNRRFYGDTLLYAVGTGGNYQNTLASAPWNESKELMKERLDAIMKYEKKSKSVTAITCVLTILLFIGSFSIGAYAAPKLSFNTNISDHSVSTESISADDMVKNFQNQSHYRNFYARMATENYEISGTIYQNSNPRSLVRFEKLPDTKLKISGNIIPVEGEIKLLYKDEAGTLITLAEGNTKNKEPISISYEIDSAQKGEIYFEATSAICEFDLSFSNSDGIKYYLTEVNPIGLAY